ncbi:PepSY-like domain-containing protein [Brachyspira sp. SAP_772]|uniref:PepSY-like domain-containing protein n=1 Tax=Brachyspira sp. SAP_772 TaxID=2608385 RepID=UPI0012F4973F|nr:PepSY-like domain-containing protein [Brachyspira sp. SAP_772]
MNAKLQFSIKITPSKLPENARKLIEFYFRNAKIIYIDKINDEYEVKLSNGTYIDFDRNGNWNYISSDEYISDNILPKPISNSLRNIIKRYGDVHIYEINKTTNFYRIKLSNYLDLRINYKGDFVSLK